MAKSRLKTLKLKPAKLKKYWVALEKAESDFLAQTNFIEAQMQKELKIDDLEFFWCDNSIVGIGNARRTMKLIHRG